MKNSFKARSALLDFVIPVSLALGISIVLFSQMITIPHKKDISFPTFNSFSNGLQDYYEFKTAWKPRIFSNILSSWTVKGSALILDITEVPMVKNEMELSISAWTVGWFLLICLIIVWVFKRRAVFYILGLFAGISFGYQVFFDTVIRVYPWDLPALFIYMLFVLLFVKQQYTWLLLLIPLGMGFKETAFILCFAFLFADLPWRTRIQMFVGSLTLAVIMKVAIDLYVHAPLFFTMETRLLNDDSPQLFLFSNLLSLKSIIPLFANAGMMIAFFMTPNVNKVISSLKWISLPFIAGNMMFGIVNEYRIWFELIPFALYALDVATNGDLFEGTPSKNGSIISIA